jgi:hypothetical protein
MIAILLKFLGPLAPYLAAGAAVLGLLAYVAWLRHDLAAANAANTVLQQTNQADTLAMAAYQKQQATMNAALDTLDTQTLARESATSNITSAITAAAPGDNGLVAPVLTKTLDSLRTLQASTP